MHNYFNKLQQHKSADGIPAYIYPPSIYGEKVSSNTIIVTEKGWIEAHRILMKEMERMPVFGPVRKQARHTKQLMEKHGLYDVNLMQIINKHIDTPTNEAGPFIIYNEDGRTAEGTYKQIQTQTGLSYNRVRDVVTGLRRMSNNWYGDKKQAKIGRLKPGGRRKDFFDNEIEENVFEDLSV